MRLCSIWMVAGLGDRCWFADEGSDAIVIVFQTAMGRKMGVHCHSI